MKSLQNQYNLISEGKGQKDTFLKEAKRLYPNLLTNSSNFKETETILKNKGVISENIVGIPALGSLKDESKKDWIKVFEENTKPEKEVEDINAHGYGNADKKNLDNQIFDQYLNGLYVELKKDPELTMEKAREIVAKNLASDPIYYTKNAAFKVDGIGYTDEAPGLTPKEITGKYKSSGYGDLKEQKLREAIRSIIKEELNEDHTSNRKNQEQGLNEYGTSDYIESYNEAVKYAQEISKKQGVVQHVNALPDGSYKISDWYDDDMTIISFENGRQL